jgi:hypothetical protein
MATLGNKQVFPASNDVEPLSAPPELDQFIALLPELYYAVNRVLEDCTPRFSKKVGVALWALAASKKEDSVGKYLTTHDLVTTLRDWFVVSEASASSGVSKLKDDLFGLQYIRIEGGSDHIHLSESGEKAFREMTAIARRDLGVTISVLKPEEQAVLLDLARRMIATKKRPASKESLDLELPPL